MAKQRRWNDMLIRESFSDVSIRYSNWTQASEQAIPWWLAGVLLTVTTRTRTVAVTCSPQSSGDLANRYS